MSTERETPILEVINLRKWFPVGNALLARNRRQVKAVDGVSFAMRRGEILSLVGESGSGKTTVGRTVLGPADPAGGTIRFDGQGITRLRRRELRPLRQRMQLVFQDPFASLNPRMTVERVVSTPLLIHGAEKSAAARRARVEEALRLVGLLPHHAARYPHELSGGQRQRVGIARAHHAPGIPRSGRAGFGARRLGPGPGREPADRAEGDARPHHPVHRA
jgi:oligopeptide transport system ATP-binding protein